MSDGTASGRSVICDVGTLATGLEKEGCAEAWIFTDFNSVKAFAYSVSQCEIECNSWSGFKQIICVLKIEQTQKLESALVPLVNCWKIDGNKRDHDLFSVSDVDNFALSIGSRPVAPHRPPET